MIGIGAGGIDVGDASRGVGGALEGAGAEVGASATAGGVISTGAAAHRPGAGGGPGTQFSSTALAGLSSIVAGAGSLFACWAAIASSGSA